MRYLLLLAIFHVSLAHFSTSAKAQAADDSTRFYTIDFSLVFGLFGASSRFSSSPFGNGGADPFAEIPADDQNREMDLIKELAGLKKETTLHYLPGLGQIAVRTSDAEHEKLAAFLKQIDKPPAMVEIDFTLVALDSNEVHRTESFKQTGSLGTETVLKLLPSEKTKVLSMSKVVTLSGVNAQVEAVEEIIYPTEFEIEQASHWVTKASVAGADLVNCPGAFETRETGHIFNVTPTVSPDRNIINLAMIPEDCELIGWIDYTVNKLEKSKHISPEKKGSCPQPVFRSFNTTTSIVVADGQPAVMSGGPHPETGESLYTIVTARVIEVIPTKKWKK